MYGAKEQCAKVDPNKPILGKDKIKYIQRVIGKLNFIARAIDRTMQLALSAIASKQAAPTKSTMNKVKQICDYVALNKEPVLTFSASDMILVSHSNGSYLSEKNAISHTSRHWFLSSNSSAPWFSPATPAPPLSMVPF